jgi:rhamnose transport system permease protein
MKPIKTLVVSRQSVLFMLLVLICLIFSLINANFRDPYNILDRTRHWVEIGMIAVPMTFIIATGGIDLSVGSLVALCGIVSGLAFQNLGCPLPLAFALGVLTGGLGGVINGFTCSFLRVPPLVVTLATMSIFRGIAMGLCQANPVRRFPESFTDWASMGSLGWSYFQIPYQSLILLILAAFGVFVFSKTVIGRWSLQIGENLKAARFTTVPVNRMYVLLYAASGVICGLASIFYTARFATAHPSAAKGLELEVIACVVIGGTRITGGNGSVLGSFLGVLILGTLRFGMEMQGVLQQYQIIIIGIIVVMTAILNESMARKPQRRM